MKEKIIEFMKLIPFKKILEWLFSNEESEESEESEE